jgi:hypothetical protein
LGESFRNFRFIGASPENERDLEKEKVSRDVYRNNN